MATQHDLTELLAFLDEGHEYPGVKSKRHPDGKTYRVPPPDAKTGLWLTSLAELGAASVAGGKLSAEDLASLSIDDDDEPQFYARVLGGAYAEMMDDGVSFVALQAIGQHAFLTFTMSQDVADAQMRSALGKARTQPPTKRAAPRTARKTAGSASRKASGGTRARTRSTASTPSSTSPSEPNAEAAAG
jgi:hypothetical protein